MLLLTRTPQKSIIIGHPDGEIRITVLDVDGPNVRLGINAPRTVAIVRDDAKEKTPACNKCGVMTESITDQLCWRCWKLETED